MKPAWDDGEALVYPSLGLGGWVRAARRGVPLILALTLAVILHGIVRLIERPITGHARPVSARIVQGVCILALRLLGLKTRLHGEVMKAPGAVVANHASWLDIFVLNAHKRIFFVAKAEVRGWVGIGWLARTAGTLFIRRDRREAKAHIDQLRQRLEVGHRLLFFPEGTSTDGRRVLPFKSTLFAPFFDEGLRNIASIQAVSVIYHAPEGLDPRYYGWWAGMDFAPSLLAILATPRNGTVDLVCHKPHRINEFTDRKSLAADLERHVRAGLDSKISR